MHLRLVATSDLHGNLLGYDYLGDRAAPGTGLVALAPVIARLRQGPGATLLFDNGDVLQGTPLGEAGTDGAGDMPVALAFDALGYDAATPGNHDFDFGVAALQRLAAAASCTVVLGNVTWQGGAPFLPPCAVLERQATDGEGRAHVLKVGVLGLTTPGVARWNAHHLAGALRVEDMVTAARRLVPDLRAAGAQIVVVLAHCGIEPGAEEPCAENAALAIAEVPGIDALFAGHTHLGFPGPDHAAARGVDPCAGRLHGVPAAMPGYGGAALAMIDLRLAPENGGWRVSDSRSALVSPDPDAAGQGDEAATLARALERAQRAALARIRRPAGSTRKPLHTHFAAVGRAPAVRAVAEAQRDWLAGALQGTEWDGLPILSAASPFRAGGRPGPAHYTDIPAGPLQARHIDELYPFANELCALEVTGDEVRRWLARAGAVFARVGPGARDAPLLVPDAPCYMIEMIDGLDVAFDLAAPPGSPARVGRIRHAGRDVAPDARFVLATNTHRRAAAPEGLGRPVSLPRRIDNRTALAQRAARAPLDPDPAPGFRFAPMPDTTVILDTAPAARNRLGEIADYAPEPLGLDPRGFLRLRLRL
ncbi:MAG: 5'-nucleotidase C-terminal domain-containing protein [Rhodosalinus sp.]